jgi:hypothetical protein
MNLRTSLCCGLLVLAAPFTGGAAPPAVSPKARERLMMKVSPAVAFAPANVIVRAVVEADKDNRAIQIVADSDEFYRSSEIQLQGAEAPHVTSVEFHSLPPGSYQFRVILRGVSGQLRASVSTSVNVLGTDVAHGIF